MYLKSIYAETATFSGRHSKLKAPFTARKMRKKPAARLCQNRACNMSIHYQESIGAPVASYSKAHSLQRLSSQTSSKKLLPGAVVVGEGILPVPAKLVKQIQSGQFVDFAELLPEHLVLLRRLQTSSVSGANEDGRRRLRRVSSLGT